MPEHLPSEPLLKLLSERQDCEGADVEAWQHLEVMRELPERTSNDLAQVQKKKLVSKVAHLNCKQALEQSAERRHEQLLEVFKGALYQLLFAEGEPIYMPSVAVTIYWPDDPHAAEQGTILPCLVVLASQHQNVMLDLLPLGRSMAEEEKDDGLHPGLVSDTQACVKALWLVQRVLHDHNACINIVTWDTSELQRAQQQLRAVTSQQLELSVVGSSLKVCC